MRSRGAERHEERGYAGPERRERDTADEIEPVVLTRKYAEAIDGIDLAGHDVGDRLPLTHHDAHLLVAEGWARPTPARATNGAAPADQETKPAKRRSEK